MERNLRENHCYVQMQKPDPSQELLNLTLEFQSQEERLAALQVQRDELLVGLQGLQESLKNQVLRVTQLEGRLGEVLQWNREGTVRGSEKGSLSSTVTPLDHYEPRRRTLTHRGRRPGRILGHIQHKPEGISQHKTDSYSQAKPHHYHSTNRPKHSKVQKPRPQPQIQAEYPTLKSQFIDYLPQPDPHQPQSQIQVQAQTRPHPTQQEQLHSHKTGSYHLTQRQAQSHNPSHPSQPQPVSKAQTHLEHTNNKQSRTEGRAPQPQSSDVLPQPQLYDPMAGSRKGEEEEQNSTKTESVIHNLLQLPVRHKIPAQPVPKKDATSK